MHKHTSNARLDVKGTMNTKDAGTVGKVLAIGASIFAACCGLAVIIHAIRWW